MKNVDAPSKRATIQEYTTAKDLQRTDETHDYNWLGKGEDF
jgi:hypothetical protein